MTTLFPQGDSTIIDSDPAALSGGTRSTIPGWLLETFTSSGTLTVAVGTTVEYLIVGGGGGGGLGAGGGGGQVRSGLLYLNAGTYAITVGSGGVGVQNVSNERGQNGGDTSIGNLVSAAGGGGGGGARASGAFPWENGADGASGGGASVNGSVSPVVAGIPGQSIIPGGFSGGLPVLSGSPATHFGSGGGGGAGQAGGNATGSAANAVGGSGGAGVQSDITGTNVYYGGGGGGAGYRTGGAAGLGGGGVGGKWFTPVVPPQSGVSGTGGGGGGAVGAVSGNGASGIVILRYAYKRGMYPYSKFSPKNMEPRVFWNLLAPNTLWQDSEGTIPVTSPGQPLGLIRDSSGNGHDLRLTNCEYVLDTEGNPRIYFNGLDSFGETDALNWGTSELTLVTSIGKLGKTPSDSIAIQFGEKDSHGSWRVLSSSTTAVDTLRVESSGTVAGVFTQSSGYVAPTTSVIAVQSNTEESSLRLRVDGAVAGNSVSNQGGGDFGNYPISVGGTVGGLYASHMFLGSTIIFDSVLTTEDVEYVEEWITRRSSDTDSGEPVIISPPSVTTPTTWDIGETMTYTPGVWSGGIVAAWWTRDGKAFAPVTSLSRVLDEDDFATHPGVVEFASNFSGEASASAFGEYVAPPWWMRAVGGIVEEQDEWVVHTFLSSQTFRAIRDIEIEYLVVGGGGGGGSGGAIARGGGGGAGQFLTNVGNTALSLSPSVYNIVVGQGGAGGVTGGNVGDNGGWSSIEGHITAMGGGGGGSGASPGLQGGSGGGGGGTGGSGTVAGGESNGPGTNAGIAGARGSGGANRSGAGGSAGTAGSTIHSGNGLSSDISGSTQWYASGGTGTNGTNAGVAGAGGGGNSSTDTNAGQHGQPNTGGGGGGSSVSGVGRSGGSGIVIIRYPKGSEIEIPDPEEAPLMGGNRWGIPGWVVHRFDEDDDLIINEDVSVEYLVVGGGGGAGGPAGGAGGGAGQVLTGSLVLTEGTLPVTVGAGGLGWQGVSLDRRGFNGDSSSIAALIVAMGGGGAGGSIAANDESGSDIEWTDGRAGGSGGGASGRPQGTSGAYSLGASGAGESVGGNAGGVSSGNDTVIWSRGGGGGAATHGSDGTGTSTGNSRGGNGGNGLPSSITGELLYYGGGGAGAGEGGGGGTGGLGGGGDGGIYGAGGNVAGSPGVDGFGGGGGGGNANSGSAPSGGRGVVYVRYRWPYVPPDELATGGSVTTADGYTIHTFNEGGTLDVHVPNLSVEYLVVGGGGGGGYAGGGAGRFLEGSTTLSGGTYPVIVGVGGTGGPPNSPPGSDGGNGGDSSIGGLLVAAGGGGGGGTGGSNGNGKNGGSGGGAGWGDAPTYPAGAVGTRISTGGNDGGTSVTGALSAGGGGGAGAVGGNSSGSTGAAGGIGAVSSITGTPVTYAAGGGGSGRDAAGAGGSGIGGNGGKWSAPASPGTSAVANTGSGGGGCTNNHAGGNGGSGVVIVRYAYVSEE